MDREEVMKKMSSMGAHPYSIASMTDAFMEGYATAVEKAKMWVERESASSMAEENVNDFIEYMEEE